MNFSLLYDIILSVFLIVVLFVNIYFTFKLNRKIKELKMYTKKLPELTAYVQKTLEAFVKSLVDLRDSGEKLQNDVNLKLEQGKELLEDLNMLNKAAERNIERLEEVNSNAYTANNINIPQKATKSGGKIKSVLDLIDNR